MKTLVHLIIAATILSLSFAFAQTSETVQLEISEDMNQFVFDESKTFDDGMPAHGSSFVTKGFVYPAGTLDGSNGVNADGTPEFPEAVIGEWLCFGTMINDAAHATGGAWVVSTQIINLSDELGGESIVTTGYEFADDSLVARAISGGTGKYAEARGEAKQSFVGLNATEGVVLTVELDIVMPEYMGSAQNEKLSGAVYGDLNN